MRKKLLLLCSLLAAFNIQAQQSVGYQDNWWKPNGTVNTVVRSGNTVYIGGNFSYVEPRIPITNGAAISTSTNMPNASYARPNGTVYASVPDGAGGWYIGGLFTQVGGQTRNNIARINADGTLHPWNPNADGRVNALAVSGNTVYAGGQFTTIGGQGRSRIAAIDATTGTATSWNLGADDYVYALAVSGGTVYAGGDFTYIGGKTRNRIAALDTITGAATTWNPNSSSTVTALAVRDTIVYVGGNFVGIGTKLRKRAAALSTNTGIANRWNPNTNTGGTVNALVISGSTVYAGGNFTSIGGQNRNYIAALDTGAGNATAWDPNANSSVSALAVSGSTVYAGGGFTTISGQSRNRIAALDSATGAATAWNPNAGGTVNALAVSGSTVYAGGNFSTIGRQTRNYIAALDATTGTLTTWNPDAGGIVYSLTASGNTVYTGGSFTTIGGQTRNRIAALDATTGAATAWDPNASSTVSTLAVSGSTVYASGSFTTIGGQSRYSIAALDTTTGLATTWNPNPTGSVHTLMVSGSTVYVGGNFYSIGGQNRNRIAALDLATGNATAWDPNASSDVRAFAVRGNTVYAGGDFTSMGGQTRNRIAAIDATTGAVTNWNPNASSYIYALAASGNNVYAGGDFSTIGGQTRSKIAALDTGSGTATTWNPSVVFNGTVAALATSGNTVYTGGGFTLMGGSSTRGYFMALTDSNYVPSATVAIAASANPICVGASVIFTATPTNATSPTYQWTKNSTVISGETAATYTTATLANSDTIRCLLTDGGTTVTSNAVTMTVSTAIATITANSPTTFCAGGSVTLTASGGASYLWSNGATPQAITVSDSGNYTVTVTNASGCSATSTATTVTVTDCTPVLTGVSPSGAICQRGTLAVAFTSSGTFNAGNVFTAQISNASGSFANPVTIGTFAGTGSSTINATLGATPAGTGYRIRIVSSNPAFVSADNGSNIVVMAVPGSAQVAVSPAGTPAICTGSSVTLSVPANAGLTYQWQVGGGNIPGATSNSYVASPTATSVYRCIVTNANGCSSTSANKTVTVKTPPVFSIAANGATTFCDGSSVTLALNATAATAAYPNYQWSNNGIAIPAATSSSYPATTSGSYTLTISDNTGCGRSAAALAVTVNPAPIATVTAGGPTTFCAGSSVVLNAASYPNQTYSWMVDATFSGSGLTRTASVSGSYRVRARLGNCYAFSPAIPVTVYSLPAAAITTNSPNPFCMGNTATLNATPNAAGFAYRWTYGSSTVLATTTAQHNVTTGGAYKVTVTDTNGCVKTSAAYSIAISSMPAATITALGSTTIGAGGSVTLQANGGSAFTYQWYRNNTFINGATSQTYVATSDGSYTVVVTNGGCSKTSAAKVVTQTAAKESLGVTSGGQDGMLEGSFSFSAFPNPADNKVTVRTNGAVSQNASIQVMTLTGAAVKEVEMKNGQTEIDLSGMATGVYLIRYKDTEGRTGIVRLVKQ